LKPGGSGEINEREFGARETGRGNRKRKQARD
jgi:hypothetical protein